MSTLTAPTAPTTRQSLPSEARAPYTLQLLTAILTRVSLAWRVQSERRALMSLSDRGLKDIGLSRADAYREASRSIFDLPNQLSANRRLRHY